MKNKKSKAGAKWSVTDDLLLLKLRKEKKLIREIAIMMKRSKGAISSRIKLLTFNKYKRLFQKPITIH